MKKKAINIFLPLFLSIFLFFSVIFAISIGSVEIEFPKVWIIIMNKIGFNIPRTYDAGEETIILTIRMPRVLMAVVIGAMLGVAGVAAQGILKNPLADPYIIGVSAAAGFGTALMVVLVLGFFSLLTIPLVAFLFAILSISIVYELSKTTYRISTTVLLLAGIAISFFFSALTSFILFFSEDKAHTILIYLMGSLWGITWIEFYIVLLVMVPSTIILFFYGRDLNLMVFGDETAQSMGVNVEQSKKIILFLMTLLTSTAVAFCGSIGFIGLIVPHTIRLLIGSNNQKLIPYSALIGGLLLLWADIFARTLIAPLEIPVGIFTALMGGPFFLYLIVKKKRKGELG
ncbi:MAG: FecCD family ABC transporter permease [Promethearchaeota archaeon]